MSSIIKIYGIIIVSMIVIFFTVEYQKKITVSNDMVQSVKTTQVSVISDCVNLGDIRLDHDVSVSKEQILDEWIRKFQKNRDLNVHYVIEIVDVNESPPAIAVRVKGYSNEDPEDMIYEYSNVVIIDE